MQRRAFSPMFHQQRCRRAPSYARASDVQPIATAAARQTACICSAFARPSNRNNCVRGKRNMLSKLATESFFKPASDPKATSVEMPRTVDAMGAQITEWRWRPIGSLVMTKTGRFFSPVMSANQTSPRDGSGMFTAHRRALRNPRRHRQDRIGRERFRTWPLRLSVVDPDTPEGRAANVQTAQDERALRQRPPRWTSDRGVLTHHAGFAHRCSPSSSTLAYPLAYSGYAVFTSDALDSDAPLPCLEKQTRMPIGTIVVNSRQGWRRHRVGSSRGRGR